MTSETFVGWIRFHQGMTRGPWKPVCRAGSEWECWDLLDMVPRSSKCCDLVVLHEGELPGKVLAAPPEARVRRSAGGNRRA